MLQQGKTHDRKIAQPLIHENEQSIIYINLTIHFKQVRKYLLHKNYPIMSFIRLISLLLRKRKRFKRHQVSMALFETNREILQSLPPNGKHEKDVILIKTEDIGDYLLFRTFLPYYSRFYRNKGYKITLLGNLGWKQVFEAYDQDFVDNVIWLDKSLFIVNKNYTKELFLSLRTYRFAIVICAERSREIASSDCLVLATAAPQKKAPKNTDQNNDFNEISDSIYTDIFSDSWSLEHEFIFNKKFAEWIINTPIEIDQPLIPISKRNNTKKIIFNIAASKKTKKWPIDNWILLIEKIKKIYSDFELFIIGGHGELKDAEAIQATIPIESLVGKLSIPETIAFLSDAHLLITNDSFALHAAVGLSTKHIIVIANGNNAFRFSDYGRISSKVISIYPTYYTQIEKMITFSSKDKWFYDAPSTDIATISASDVLEKTIDILH